MPSGAFTTRRSGRSSTYVGKPRTADTFAPSFCPQPSRSVGGSFVALRPPHHTFLDCQPIAAVVIQNSETQHVRRPGRTGGRFSTSRQSGTIEPAESIRGGAK